MPNAFSEEQLDPKGRKQEGSGKSEIYILLGGNVNCSLSWAAGNLGTAGDDLKMKSACTFS